MKFIETKLKGAFIIEPRLISDDRGFFSRSFCQKEFLEHGLNPAFVQNNISSSKRKGTLRGLHYQEYPNEEAKLIRCTAGSIYDVIVDVRPTSPDFKCWLGILLSAANHRMLYCPEGFAHGYLTLEDNTEVSYQVSAFYAPASERIIRWDDPAIAIDWPIKPVVFSSKDSTAPLLPQHV